MLKEESYQLAAKTIGCTVSAIKAVDRVESNGAGMIDGRPVILFEPHIWWKELRKAGVAPETLLKEYGDMLYQKWGTKPYPKGQDAQHARLARAIAVGKGMPKERVLRDAALRSCSWGRFQICGFNYGATGSASVQEFINRIYQGDEEHLQLFVAYVKSEHLDDELRAQDWKSFALQYNGSLYYKNQYDTKLRTAEASFR